MNWRRLTLLALWTVLAVGSPASTGATAEVLWEINLGAPVMGFPVTYAVSGRQYVAVNTGPGRLTNARMTPELRHGRGSNLFVFALP